MRVKNAVSFHLRFLGLMAKGKWPQEYDALWFPRCGSVHTFFTFLRPDLLFLDSNYKVLSLHPQTPAWRLWWGPRGTSGCLEIPPGEAQRWGWRVGTNLEKLFNRKTAVNPRKRRYTKEGKRLSLTTRKRNVQTWIGIAEVIPKPRKKKLIRGKSASVNVLAIANSVLSFGEIAGKTLNRMGFEVPEISDIEPFKRRLSHSEVAKGILALEKKLSKTNPVVLDVFHSYKKE